MAKSPRKPQPLQAKRGSFKRNEVMTIEGFMAEFDSKDRRTAEKIVKSLGLPFEPKHGKLFINGEAFFQATFNDGEPE